MLKKILVLGVIVFVISLSAAFAGEPWVMSIQGMLVAMDSFRSLLLPWLATVEIPLVILVRVVRVVQQIVERVRLLQ